MMKNNKNGPVLAVVVPCYNEEEVLMESAAILQKFLQTQIDSAAVSEDSYILMVDDGSKDNSLLVVKAVDDPRVRVIHKENGGVSSARNRGIKEAKGEYIALLDGDDLWEPTFLEEQVKLIHDFPEAAMWGVSIAFIKYGK